jgi:hypothetical protein
MPGDVVKMMDWVVEQVAAESRDAEAGAVAAPTGPEPLLAAHTVEAIGQCRCGRSQLRRDNGRVLLAVTRLDRPDVLVPVRVQRVVPPTT